MSARRGRLIGVLLATCAMSTLAAEKPSSVKQSDKSIAPDLEFLEYLGTLENDGENWTDIVNVDLPRAPKAKGATDKDKAKPEVAAKSARTEK